VRVALHPDVEGELGEAALWYEDQVLGLGEDLLTDVEAVRTSVPASLRLLATPEGRLAISTAFDVNHSGVLEMVGLRSVWLSENPASASIGVEPILTGLCPKGRRV
jgi:hypothetical protein